MTKEKAWTAFLTQRQLTYSSTLHPDQIWDAAWDAALAMVQAATDHHLCDLERGCCQRDIARIIREARR